RRSPPTLPYTTLLRSNELELPAVEIDRLAHDLAVAMDADPAEPELFVGQADHLEDEAVQVGIGEPVPEVDPGGLGGYCSMHLRVDRKSTRLNSSHVKI